MDLVLSRCPVHGKLGSSTDKSALIEQGGSGFDSRPGFYPRNAAGAKHPTIMAKTASAAESSLPPQFKSWGKDNYRSKTGRSDVPSIGIGKSGTFLLSHTLSNLLKLSKGAGIAFHLDAAQEQWYVERDDQGGIELREDSKGMLVFNSTALYKAMEPQFPEDVKSGRARVNPEPERIAKRLLYPVLTASMRPSERTRKA